MSNPTSVNSHRVSQTENGHFAEKNHEQSNDYTRIIEAALKEIEAIKVVLEGTTKGPSWRKCPATLEAMIMAHKRETSTNEVATALSKRAVSPEIQPAKSTKRKRNPVGNRELTELYNDRHTRTVNGLRGRVKQPEDQKSSS